MEELRQNPNSSELGIRGEEMELNVIDNTFKQCSYEVKRKNKGESWTQIGVEGITYF